jgi:hypothetical protein
MGFARKIQRLPSVFSEEQNERTPKSVSGAEFELPSFIFEISSNTLCWSLETRAFLRDSKASEKGHSGARRRIDPLNATNNFIREKLEPLSIDKPLGLTPSRRSSRLQLSLSLPLKACVYWNTFFATLVVLSCASAVFRIPISRSSWFLLGASLCLAVYLASHLRVQVIVRCLAHSGIALAAGLSGALLSTRFFYTGFLSWYPDAWSYCGFAQYLEQYSRGRLVGSNPMTAMAAGLSGTRFGTPALLALFNNLTRVNVVTCAVFFWCFVTITLYLGSYLLARACKFNTFGAIFFGLFCVTSGWVLDALLIGSWDNLLFVCFLPGVIANGILLSKRSFSRRFLILVAVPLGALLYVYPEGVLISAVLFCPLLFLLTFQLFRGAPQRIWQFLLMICGAVIVALPYLPIFLPFVVQQLATGAQHPRPGESTFPRLLTINPDLLPSLFGFGTEFGTVKVGLPDHILAVAVFITLAAGLVGANKTVRSLICSLLPLAGLLLWFDVHEKYDYAAFKLLLIALPAYGIALCQGAMNLSKIFSGERTRLFLTAAILFLPPWLGRASHSCLFANRPAIALDPYNTRSLRQYADLVQVVRIAQKRPILFLANDEARLAWGLIFLNGSSLVIPNKPWYLAAPGYMALAARMEPVRGRVDLVLSDSATGPSRWNNGILFLRRVPERGTIVDVQAPCGLENQGDATCFWMDNRPVTVSVYCLHPERARLTVSGWSPGPDIAQQGQTSVRFQLGSEIKTLSPDQRELGAVDLRAGLNQISLQCLAEDNGATNSNGDPRRLLIGLKGLTLDSE